jgi:UDP-GlcNAc:undecaprenyl-phosphate/decaprenyl-phosphate GlcNAc-1-phosphate transferase
MLVFIISLLIAAIISPQIIKVYKKNKWVDDPKKEPHAKKTHSQPVPRGGGIVIFLAILIPALLFLNIDKYLIAILLGAFILALVGTWDDIKDIHPAIRIFSGLLASSIVVFSGIGISYISNPFGTGVLHLAPALANALALIFILWNMNIVNWSKGVDGQLPGLATISAIFIGLLALSFNDNPTQFNTSNLSFIVAGAFAGFLIYNFYPQKIMPGYGAGSLAGFFLSVLAILSGAKVATMLMVLAIPTADGIFTIFRRIIAGKSPLWGDRGHLHHKLIDILGWGKRRVAIFYWLTSLVMGILSLFLKTPGKLIAISLVICFVFGFLIWAKVNKIKLNK